VQDKDMHPMIYRNVSSTMPEPIRWQTTKKASRH